MGITAGSREVPGRNACDRRHTYCIIIIIIAPVQRNKQNKKESSSSYIFHGVGPLVFLLWPHVIRSVVGREGKRKILYHCLLPVDKD